MPQSHALLRPAESWDGRPMDKLPDGRSAAGLGRAMERGVATMVVATMLASVLVDGRQSSCVQSMN